jgi:cobaltochelatase CobS
MPVRIVNKSTDKKQHTNGKATVASKPKQTEEPVATESFNPRRLAARPRQACLRCGEMIPKGTLIERIEHPTRKGHVWIHAHCEPTTKVAVAQPSGMTQDEVDDLLERFEGLRELLAEVKAGQPQIIEVKIADRAPVKIEGLKHDAFDEVVKLLTIGMPVFLPGPAGCGKSHLAEQVAKALGQNFASISCTAGMSESQLLGRSLPTGDAGQFTFCSTPFLDCYENGGVFLFDEMDAADPNVLLVINSALANGFLSVPARHEKPVAVKHPDFRCIAAANTFGKGADRQYCGRNPLDESTLDRFRIGTIPVDYNRELERQLWKKYAVAGMDNVLEAIWKYRDAVAANRLERCVSTRFIVQAAEVTRLGFGLSYIESKLFAGWRADEIQKVKGGV